MHGTSEKVLTMFILLSGYCIFAVQLRLSQDTDKASGYLKSSCWRWKIRPFFASTGLNYFLHFLLCIVAHTTTTHTI